MAILLAMSRVGVQVRPVSIPESVQVRPVIKLPIAAPEIIKKNQNLVNSPLSLQFIFKVVPIVVTLWTLSSPSWMPSCVWQTVIHPDSNAENILFDSYTYFFVKIVHFIYQEKPK